MMMNYSCYYYYYYYYYYCYYYYYYYYYHHHYSYYPVSILKFAECVMDVWMVWFFNIPPQKSWNGSVHMIQISRRPTPAPVRGKKHATILHCKKASSFSSQLLKWAKWKALCTHPMKYCLAKMMGSLFNDLHPPKTNMTMENCNFW